MYHTLLHATDLKENHFDLCARAVSLAQIFNATLYLIHVIEIPSSIQWAQSLGFAEMGVPVTDGAESVMSSIADALNIPSEQLIVKIGSVSSNIIETANHLGANLIILGSDQSHNTSTLPSFPSNKAGALLHHANCDVIVIKDKDLVSAADY